MFASHTRLEKADECLFAFFQEYVRKVKVPPNAPAIEGSGFHAVAELYGRHCVAQGVASDEDAIPGIVKQVCFNADDPRAPGATFYPRILAIAQSWASRTVFDPDKVVDFELRLPQGWDPERRIYPPNNVGRHLFVGVVDLLELDGDTLVIRDYKTTRSVPTQSAVENSAQLRRYVGLLWQAYPQFERYRVELEFVRYGEVRWAEFGPGTGQLALEEVEAQIDQIERKVQAVRSEPDRVEEYFPPTPGAHCAYCPVWRLCPLAKNEAFDPPVTDEESAKKAVGDLLVLRRRASELQAAIRAYAEQADPVEVGGVSAGFHERTKRGFEDAKAFFERCIEVGEDPWLYLTVDNRKAKRLMDRDDFAGLVEESVDVRFDLVKIKEDGGNHED